MAKHDKGTPMLARTHGQSASPTTVGKELANFAFRCNNYYQELEKHRFYGKLNGAVGNFNTHYFVYPEFDWVDITKNFIENLDLKFNPYTT